MISVRWVIITLGIFLNNQEITSILPSSDLKAKSSDVKSPKLLRD